MVRMSTIKTQSKEKSFHDTCIVMCVSDVLRLVSLLYANYLAMI